jgi:hypothetical protein
VTVCPDTCDYTQIADALASVGADTTVQVSPGKYNEAGASAIVSVANVTLVYASTIYGSLFPTPASRPRGALVILVRRLTDSPSLSRSLSLSRSVRA